MFKPIAFPTETVYGLGAPIFSEDLIAEIFRLKGRPADNPLIAHISDLHQLDQIVVDPPKEFFKLASHFFPGPLSIVLKKSRDVPDIVTGGLPTLAVRMPSLEVARALIRKVGMPMVAPSANLSGKPSSTCAAHVRADFGDQVDVIEGECSIGLESTVISLDPVPTLLRPGAITREEIEKVLGVTLLIAQECERPLSPGMKYRHYAPDANVRLFSDRGELVRYLEQSSARIHSFEASAHNLYHELREADLKECQEVAILYDQNDAAISNRLHKSARKPSLD